MNKKGFTLVELLVTIAISTLVLSLGVITVNNVIDNSKTKTITLAHENIKKGANLYSREFYDEIVWLNNQSCISVEQLIAKGYISRDKAEKAQLKYIIIKKDNNNTIISERNSDGKNDKNTGKNDGDICGAIINQTAASPTNKEICNLQENLVYDGKIKNLTKSQREIGDIYVLSNPEVKETNAGSYPIEIGLNNGYYWKDGSIDKENNTPSKKMVYCTIQKGIPNLKLMNKDMTDEIYGQDGEQTIPIEVTVTSDVPGTIELKSSNNKYVTVELSENNEQPNSNKLENKGDKYIKNIIIKNNANRKTNTYITIKQNPSNSNYQSTTTTYTIGNVTDIKREIPKETFCTNPRFNGEVQIITKEAEVGYTLFNNYQTHVRDDYEITASLHPGFIWEDGTTEDKTFTCAIKPLTYKISYKGKEHTGGSMTSSIHTYGVAKNLEENKFIRKGYNFIGWSSVENGEVKYRDQESVINLIEVTTKDKEPEINLYTKWAINTGRIYYYPNGGSAVEKWPLLTKEYDDGSYAGASSAIHTFDYNSTTLNLNDVTAIFSRTGYHIPNNETAWRVGSATSTTYLSQTSQDMSSYVEKENNVRLKVYANWKANTYTINYDANGGSGTTASSKHSYDTAKKLTANGFTRKGYTFMGWSTSASGAVVYTDSQSVTNLSSSNGATVTLYAQWAIKTYTVTYNGNGGLYNGSSTWSEKSTYGVPYTTYDNFFTRKGYTFKGWKDQNGTDWTGDIGKPWTWSYDYDVTLYAQWQVKTYTVTYNGNGGLYNGSSTWSEKSTYGVPYTTYNNFFTRAGYTFTGWKDQNGTSWTGDIGKPWTWSYDYDVTLYAQWADRTAPTCTVSYTQTEWTSSGVDVTVTCSDSGSGCATAKQYGYNLKANKTYTVKDNAGNSGTCTASIQNRTIYRTRTSSTKYEAKCIYYEVGAPEVSGGTYASKKGFANTTECKNYCRGFQLGVGYLEPKCTSYTAYSDWGVWKTTSCTPSTTCESLKQYKKK